MLTIKRISQLPSGILDQHMAVLGKTGSGKTSTAKLFIEHVVAGGGRVCILDPIKSDWWGLTSSANGERSGLPFQILGGPRGHVPLHSSAGKAIAEIVANGALPLSIIDMADFQPGGLAQFFVDFAPKLLQKMRGVVYLVIEEAHLFAPKERSGIGAESMSIHWAKTMATAGRSKGIRLVLLTQRTQALHNALLGSCDTLIAHRLTAPADQEPVIKWLKANTDKETTATVAGSLASLKTGTAWVCSGEAKIFEQVAFPRIKTYDNTATPTGDGSEHAVKMAPVDTEKLLAIVGDAVEEAKANDPKELKKKLSEKDREIAKLSQQLATKAPVIDQKATEQAISMALAARDQHWKAELAKFEKSQSAIVKRMCTAKGLAENLVQLVSLNGDTTVEVQAPPAVNKPASLSNKTGVSRDNSVRSVINRPASVITAEGVTARQQRFLDAAASLTTLGADVTRETVAGWVGVHPRGGSVGEELKALVDAGLITMERGRIEVTDSGHKAAGYVDPAQAIERAKSGLTARQARFFELIIEAYPESTTREAIAEHFNLHPRGGSLGEDLNRLVGRGLVEGGRGQFRARDFLFAGT